MAEPIPCYLGNLPVELILCICDSLQPVDITSLALTNNSLIKVLKRHFPYLFEKTSSFQLAENHRIDFLKMMDPKLPHLHFCFDCLGLHKWENIKLPELKYPILTSYDAEKKKDGLCIGGKPARQRGPYYLLPPVQFRFTHLQLAMRWFQHGPSFGISPDSLRYTEVREAISDLGLKTTRLISVETRIMSAGLETFKSKPSLCLRVQELRYTPKVSWVDTKIYPDEDHMIRSQIDQHEPWVHRNSRPRKRSRFMILKFELFEPMVLEKTEVTKWIDLGPGISPDVTVLPDAIYSRSSSRDHIFIVGGIGSGHGATYWRFGNPDPYSRFEGHDLKPRYDTISVDDLASLNNYLLCDERYRLVMNSIGPSHWVLQGENEHRSAWQTYENLLFEAVH